MKEYEGNLRKCGIKSSHDNKLDYYYSDNLGHIFIKLTNDGKEGKDVVVARGSAFAQGIFLPYGITYNDDADGVRNGGFGSTDSRQ